MEKDIAELKKTFEEIVAAPPFNGTVTHRTRPMFIAKWKEVLTAKGVKGQGYVNDLLVAMGKKALY